MTGLIDIEFVFTDDTPPGKDPDSHSPTLRRYHHLLWSKPLPDGRPFELSVDHPYTYLHHCSNGVGEFWLSSDAVMATLWRKPTVARILELFDDSFLRQFMEKGYTIGAMMIFPGNRVGRAMTINQARGLHPRIADRFDLTLECIRRHYSGERSPLQEALVRYADYFELFDDFRGYVDFFVLQDLIDVHGAVRFFMPFDDFESTAIPQDVETYVEYRRRSIAFIDARNRRIQQLGL